MAGEKITYYDITDASDPPVSWSPNTLRTRLALNFKGIPYETRWLSYPDIAPTLSGLGAPKYDPLMGYTLPAISSKSLPVPMQDSTPIAEYLDATYTGLPKLFPPGARAAATGIEVHLNNSIFSHTFPLALPRARDILDPRGKEYFERTRKVWFGMSLDEFGKTAEPEKFLKALKGWDKILAAEKGGPFVLGETPSYGDIIVVAFLRWLEIVYKDMFEKVIVVGDGNLGKLYEAGRKWI